MLFFDERSLAIRAAFGFEAAGAANVARLIEEAPPNLHNSILRAANSPLIRFDMSDSPYVDHTNHADWSSVEARIEPFLAITTMVTSALMLKSRDRSCHHIYRMRWQRCVAMMRGERCGEMNLSIELSNSSWLNVGTRFERPPIQWPIYSMLTFALSAAVILIGIFWFLMTRLTGPLRCLVSAADRLGRGEHVADLPMVGPSEVRDLTVTFNLMQDRLSRFVADRTRLLAALDMTYDPLSHHCAFELKWSLMMKFEKA